MPHHVGVSPAEVSDSSGGWAGNGCRRGDSQHLPPAAATCRPCPPPPARCGRSAARAALQCAVRNNGPRPGKDSDASQKAWAGVAAYTHTQRTTPLSPLGVEIAGSRPPGVNDRLPWCRATARATGEVPAGATALDGAGPVEAQAKAHGTQAKAHGRLSPLVFTPHASGGGDRETTRSGGWCSLRPRSVPNTLGGCVPRKDSGGGKRRRSRAAGKGKPC